jgi:hypothetical protein
MRKKIHQLESFLSKQRLTTAYVFKVVVPLLLFLLTHLTYTLLLGADYPMLRVAAQGEWLLISAMMLMDATIELRRIGSRYDKLLGSCAVLIFLLFGAVKYAVVHTAFALSASGAPPDNLRSLIALSFFTSAITLCSLVASLYVFSIVSRETTERRLMRMAL